MTQGVIDARKVSINQYIIVRPKVDQTSSPELDMSIFLIQSINIWYLIELANYRVAQKVRHYRMIKKLVLNCIKPDNGIGFIRQIKV